MALSFDFIIKDKGSKTLDHIGDSAKKTSGKFDGLKAAAVGGAAAAGAAAVKFATDSVKAFSESQTSQTALATAFAKFKIPKSALAGIQSMNGELAKKVKFDDDALASGQSVLAGFKLSGDQIKQITPLLADYAAKTGKSIPEAATILGKSMLGATKPLKGIGLNLKDAGSVGGNFTQVMAGLRSQVGGFATAEGKTAAGQAAILSNQFGEVQESVGSKLVPVLTKLGAGLLTIIDFADRNSKVLLPLAGVAAGVAGAVWGITAASKAFTAVQAALNIVLRANPLILVGTLLVALGAGLVLAYKKSATFRAIVDGAFKAIAAAGKWMWENVLRPAFEALKLGVAAIGTAFTTVKETIGSAWEGIKKGVGGAIRWVVEKFLGFAGSIIDTAATAFGWVPGLGPQLKEASKKFGEFRKDVNEALGGINDKTVTVTAGVAAAAAANVRRVEDVYRRKTGKESAAGGWMRGPGTGTSDSIPAWLSNGEYVVRASQARKHGDLLEAINSGAHGYAKGGPVGLNLAAATSGAGTLQKNALGIIQKWAQRNVEKMLGDVLGPTPGGPFPGGSSAIGTWRGKRYTHAMIARLMKAERLAGATMYVSQGGFRPTTSYSGTTHNRDAVDVGSPTTVRMQNALRAAGIAAWIRTPDQGPWRRHIHGVPLPGGGVQLSASARAQTQSFLRGGNGLRGYDRGGILPPGLTMAYNGTGRPEMVVPPGKAAGGTTVIYEVHVHGGVYGDKRQAGRELIDSIEAAIGGGYKTRLATR